MLWRTIMFSWREFGTKFGGFFVYRITPYIDLYLNPCGVRYSPVNKKSVRRKYSPFLSLDLSKNAIEPMFNCQTPNIQWIQEWLNENQYLCCLICCIEFPTIYHSQQLSCLSALYTAAFFPMTWVTFAFHTKNLGLSNCSLSMNATKYYATSALVHCSQMTPKICSCRSFPAALTITSGLHLHWAHAHEHL